MTNTGRMWLVYWLARRCVCDTAICGVKSELINCMLRDTWEKDENLISGYLVRLLLKQEVLEPFLNHREV